jgi:hypothetical protein
MVGAEQPTKSKSADAEIQVRWSFIDTSREVDGAGMVGNRRMYPRPVWGNTSTA